MPALSRLFTPDTETELIATGNQVPRMVCVATNTLDRAGHSVSTLWHTADESTLDHLKGALLDPGTLLLNQTMAYDVMVTSERWPELFPLWIDAYEQDRVTCIEIRQKLLDIAEGKRKFMFDDDGEVKKTKYDLATLAWRHLKKRLDKGGDTWRLKYGELMYVPLEEWPHAAKAYPISDVETARDVFLVQDQQSHYLDDQFRQSRAHLWLKIMSAWGIITDAEGVMLFKAKTEREYETLAAICREYGLLRKDGSRNLKYAKELIAWAYAQQGLKAPRSKSDKNISTAAIVCKESGYAPLEALGELGVVGAVLAKDVPMLELGMYQPIHSYFEPILDTGRTSSSKPNIQNIRRAEGIRECFIPRPGKVFVSADYGKLELCTLAQVCFSVLGWSVLGDTLNAGRDPHLMMAATMLGATYEYIEPIYLAEAKDSKEWQEIDNARQGGKVSNFGFPGGLGAAAFVDYAKDGYGLILTPQQAKELKGYWYVTFPEMRQYLDWIGTLTAQGKAEIRQLFSNRVRLVSGPRIFTQAANTLFQGLGGDIGKAAGWLVMKGCYLLKSSPLFGCRMVNFIHDEFCLESDEATCHEAGQELSRLMVLAAKPWLPNVNIEAKPCASRRWSKKSKTVYKDGRLVPCA